MNNKLMTSQQAAQLIEDGDTLCVLGMTLVGAAESVLSALEQRFLTSGSPRGLTYVHSAGQSDRQRGNQHLAHIGMVARVIGSHCGLAPRWMELIADNQVEAFCLPQGPLAHLYSAMAAGLPGYLSQVGISTFVDPRI